MAIDESGFDWDRPLQLLCNDCLHKFTVEPPWPSEVIHETRWPAVPCPECNSLETCWCTGCAAYELLDGSPETSEW